MYSSNNPEQASEKRYRQYSSYLKEQFGCKVYKATIDGGFSCPNRDGVLSLKGCIFCEDSGSFSQAHSSELDVEKQLEYCIKTLEKRFGAKKFIAYFQAYSNTYASVEKLKSIYDKVFWKEEVLGLSIGTRPDCIDREKLLLLSSYAEEKPVWIEYGLQSIHNKTLKLINRRHTAEDFMRTYELTRAVAKKVKICVHVILGLPGENRQDMLETAKTLSKLGIDGIKIHQLCVLKGTELEKMYLNNQIELFSQSGPSEYVNLVCDYIEILPPQTVIHRIAGNGLKKLLIAPLWLGQKFKTLNMIDKELQKRGSFQGCLL